MSLPGDLRWSASFQRRWFRAMGEGLGERMPATTPEHTGLCTDGNDRDRIPDVVGLHCERSGDESETLQLSDARVAHRLLRGRFPRTVDLLGRPYHRALRTSERGPGRPGAQGNRYAVLARAERIEDVRLCYQRWSIVEGHRRAGRPLLAEEIQALDDLDHALSAASAVTRLRPRSGEMLWLNNRVIAHGWCAERLGTSDLLLRKQWIRHRNGRAASASA